MRRKLRFVAALLTCVIYLIALLQSIRAYEAREQAELEGIPPHLRCYADDFDTYISSIYGVQMIIAGVLIILGWLTVAIIRSKRSKKKEQSLQA